MLGLQTARESRARRLSTVRWAFRVGILGVVAACSPADSGSSTVAGRIVAEDKGGHTVRLDAPATRVVAVLPSVNELLVAMGAQAVIVARTDYDTHPALAALPSIGGGLDPSVEMLISLRPDLFVAWGGRAHDTMRRRLEASGIATFGVGTQDTTDIFQSIHALGVLTGFDREADSLHAALSAELAATAESVRGLSRPTVLYALSVDPPMTTSAGTYVSELIAVAGGRNLFDDLGNDFPSVGLEEIVRRDPDFILLPTGTLSEAQRVERLRATAGWRDLSAVREGRIITVPSTILDVPGPRMGEAARMIRDGLHGSGVNAGLDRNRGAGPNAEGTAAASVADSSAPG